jgi:hypothetical protein
MIYDFSRYSEREMPSHHHTLSAKLFSYIQAGLPVLISEEYRFMAGICRKYGIGLVLSRAEVAHLRDRLAEVDYEQLLINVESAKQELDLRNHWPEFEGLLRVD